jgi:hypothetical protein
VNSSFGWILVAAVVGGAIALYHLMQYSQRARQPANAAARPEIAEIYEGLRAGALGQTAAGLGLSPPKDALAAHAAVVDWRMKGPFATLTATLTGELAVYISDGGGVFGEAKEAAVREAALEFVRRTADAIGTMAVTTTFTLPPPGRTRFYLLTNRGVFAAEVADDLLTAGEVQLSSSWAAAQAALLVLQSPPA